jgi:energy-coupling factor transporter transmembrane protein EcfT
MIRFGEYLDRRSFTHRLDVRVKILSVLLLSIIVFQAQGAQIGLLSIFLGVICLISHLRPSILLQALRPLVWFAVLLFGLHLFFTDGAALIEIPLLPIRITEAGLYRGLLVTWQFIALALCGAILTMTTSPSDLIHGLEHLLRPLRYLRVPSQDIAVMVAMALRFVPTFLEEFDRIRTAQAARGGDVEAGRIDRRLKTLATLVIPLMASAFRRADELAEAMEARGYAPGPRTSLNRLHFGTNEIIALFILGIMFVAAGTPF